MGKKFIDAPHPHATSDNNMETLFPDVARQWSARNPVLPSDVLPNSNKYAWWICDKGHHYDAAIAKRTHGRGCPYCSGRKTLPGFNDLATTHPEIASELDDDKNNSITAHDVTAGSSKRKLWWKCSKGHEACSTVAKRVKSRGCPQCTTRVKRGYLSVEYPDIAKQWDYEKNEHLTPSDVTSGSKKKVWWICDKGHSFRAAVQEKTSSTSSMCPYCSSREVLAGFNDLQSCSSQLAQEWDDEKNGELTPQNITQKSMKEVWWKCSQGHSWKSSPNRRFYNSSCPYCSGFRVIPGENDIATTHPDIAAQWDYEKNTSTPRDITIGSNKKVWWICDKGHSYQRSPKSRLTSGCSYCSGRKTLTGFNDLVTTHPHLVDRQWDFEKNDTPPEDVTHGMRASVWWTCDKGHSYQMAIQSKTRRESTGCSICSQSQAERDVAEYISSIVGEDNVRVSLHNIISPYELDIYVPEKNIAIEFNGVYWHCESCRSDRYYHYNKWKACKDKGIQLITIWEDEWRDRQDIVKSMLSHKLGASQDARIYARTCTVSPLTASVAREFLDTYHIQGGTSASAHFGLYDDSNKLVAVSSWRKNKDILYLDRYATSCTVVGGMGRLLKAGKKFAIQNNLSRIVTFSDNCVSDGGLYEKLGFTRDSNIAPDYKYVVSGQRKHKFGYRLKRFRTDKSLLYKEGLTEKQLAKLNGLERIWDCGKVRWVMDISSKNRACKDDDVYHKC